MFVVYVIQSEVTGRFYIGSTEDLRRRMQEHESGSVISTKHRRPLQLLCYEAYRTKSEALKREKYLKSSDGRKELKIRLQESLSET